MLYGALPELDHARQGVSAQLVYDIDIAVVTPDRLDAFVQTTAEGFGWEADWREAAMADLRARVVDDNVIHLLAVYRGEPAGVADLRLHDGVASLGNGSRQARVPASWRTQRSHCPPTGSRQTRGSRTRRRRRELRIGQLPQPAASRLSPGLHRSGWTRPS